MSTVLIYRLGSLGDTLVALPALRLVAAAYPRARRVVVTNAAPGSHVASMRDVLEPTGLIDAYITYPTGVRGPRELMALAARLRAEHAATLVYLAAPRGRAALLRDVAFFGAGGVRHFVGLPWRADLQASPARADGRVEREGERLLRAIGELGAVDVADPGVYGLRARPAARDWAAAALAGVAGRPLICCSVGTKVPANDWEDAHWAPLLRELAARHPGHALVAVGAGSERARMEALAAPWAGRCVNLCGDASVEQSLAVLARGAVFIGHDSGPMHLAAAAGARCVAIFSARQAPGCWFPFGTGHEVLARSIDCQGCGLEICEARAKACIRSIGVDEVLAAVERVLAGPPPDPA
jgi:ADP-heptose:LPS heptosyltransferase